MTVELYLDGRRLTERADAARLGVALIALRGRHGAELELAGESRSLFLETGRRGLYASLLDDVGQGHGAWVSWDLAVEAAAEFLAGMPGRSGGLLAGLRTPPVLDDDCPACQAIKEERL